MGGSDAVGAVVRQRSRSPRGEVESPAPDPRSRAPVAARPVPGRSPPGCAQHEGRKHTSTSPAGTLRSNDPRPRRQSPLPTTFSPCLPVGAGQSFVEQLHPMPHRQLGAGLDMRQAADVGGGDDLGRPDSSAWTLLPSSCLRELRLQDRVGARGAAAQVRIGHRGQREAGRREQRLRQPADLLAVLERARGVEGDARRGVRREA